METAIVILIVFAAAIYVGRIFYRGLNRKGDCTCGCSCCGASNTCSETTADHAARVPSGNKHR